MQLINRLICLGMVETIKENGPLVMVTMCVKVTTFKELEETHEFDILIETWGIQSIQFMYPIGLSLAQFA